MSRGMTYVIKFTEDSEVRLSSDPCYITQGLHRNEDSSAESLPDMDSRAIVADPTTEEAPQIEYRICQGQLGRASQVQTGLTRNLIPNFPLQLSILSVVLTRWCE